MVSIKSGLHAGNILVGLACCGADVVLTGGATTAMNVTSGAIGAALSGHDLLTDELKQFQPLADRINAAYKAQIAAKSLSQDQSDTLTDMLRQSGLNRDMILACDKVPKLIAEALRANLADSSNPDHRPPFMLDTFAAITITVFGPLKSDPDFAGLLAGDFQSQVLQNQTVAEKKIDDLSEEVAFLRERLDSSGTSDRLAAEGITERAIIRLTKRAIGTTHDLGDAWDELQNFINLAIRVQEEGRTTSNHPDFVDEVIKRAAELSADGAYEAAQAELMLALAEEEAASNARKSKLLRAAADQAILAGDYAAAAAHLWADRQLDLTPQDDAFAALHALQNHYYVKGRDQGTMLDLRLSVALANLTISLAKTSDQIGAAQNDLGIVLATLGERSGDSDTFDRAVTAYQAALTELTQDRVPLHWATTQNNLGAALQYIGERSGDTDTLDRAVAAFQAALTERTQDRVPLDWAMTQNNLGNALHTLSERSGDPDMLDRAVTAYQAALTERTQERVPLDWAATQNNLGNLFRTRFDLAGNPADLDTAQSHLDAARAVFVEKGADAYIAIADTIQQQITDRRAGLGPD